MNAIRPGFIETAQTADTYDEDSERYRRITERAAAGQIGTPGDVAGAAIYLASDAAKYTTGAMLTVDGGFETGAFEQVISNCAVSNEHAASTPSRPTGP